ncbi:MAG: hypothetical protein WKG01_23045 [Kofleriaceae bacterium]
MLRIWWLSFVMGCWTNPAPVLPAAKPVATPAPVAAAPAPAPDLAWLEPRAPGQLPSFEVARLARADFLVNQRGLTHDTALLVIEVEDASMLVLGGVGIAGTTTAIETAARNLAARPDAAMAANHLVHHTQGAPRLYGLWILAAVDPAGTPTAAAMLRKDRRMVGRIDGCVVQAREPIAVLVDNVLARPLR